MRIITRSAGSNIMLVQIQFCTKIRSSWTQLNGLYVVEKCNVKLEKFQLGSFKMERSILCWKEPFEVRKLKINLGTTALIGMEKLKLETTTLVGKLKMKLEKLDYIQFDICSNFWVMSKVDGPAKEDGLTKMDESGLK